MTDPNPSLGVLGGVGHCMLTSRSIFLLRLLLLPPVALQKNKWTALHCAVTIPNEEKANRVECVEVLIKAGCNVDAGDVSDASQCCGRSLFYMGLQRAVHDGSKRLTCTQPTPQNRGFTTIQDSFCGVGWV